MQRSFFDVTPVELGQLGSEPAVAVVREMIWAEVNNLGIPISDADIPFAVTSPDGGVDAVVRAEPKSAGNGLILLPMTSYQVKAGDFDLSATATAQIEKLLMTPSAIQARIKAKAQLSGTFHKVEDISPRIRACLDAGGTFVTMLFGNDNVDTREDATENAIRKFLGEVDAKYKDAKVRVWRQSRICGLLRQFPGVSLQIKNLADFQLLSHDQWSDRAEMQQAFVAAPDQQKVMEALRAAMRDDSQGTIHVRLIGEPGIGKTRLVLETLRADDVKPLVLYADKGSKVDGSVISAIRGAKDARVILVVDECSPELRSDLVRNFGKIGPNLKIISIYQDAEEGDRSSEYRLFDVPVLPNQEIEAILKSYGIDPAYAKGWAEMCDGSPRVAHVVGQNLRERPTDPLKSDGTSMIWVRYLAADVDRNTDTYRRRHLVLSSLALFKRFGWSPAVQAGAHEIYDRIISKLDGGLSRAEFVTIIDQMAARKVLQGDNFLYITPRALHIKFWIDWWNLYGAAIDMIDMIPHLSPPMRLWFGEMIEYADAAPVSKQLVAKLLGPDGLYADAEWLKTREGARFFFSLSLADPPGALRLLERTIGKMDRAELLAFEQGRRDVISALENMALFAELFRPAAKLLLALADAENETWSNNATGVFAGLFSLGYGEVAPTSLAPELRLPILTEAISQGGLRVGIALKAFESALHLQSITRWGGDQPFRLNKLVTRWRPTTNQEWWDAYKLYWVTLRKCLTSPALSYQSADILLSRMRDLLRIEYLHDEIVDTISEIAALPDYDQRKTISDIELVLKYDARGLPEPVVSKLESQRDALVGVSFGSRLKRYAGMSLLHDEYDSDGNETNEAVVDIRLLAKEALANPDELKKELPWLVTDEAKNGFRFGAALSKQDTKGTIWPDILKAWRTAGEASSDYFIGGYLQPIFVRDREAWERTIRDLSTDPTVLKSLPGFIWRSGMTENAARLILELAKAKKILPERLVIFSMGGVAAPISDQLFWEWLDFLVGVGTFGAGATALNLASMSMLGGRQLTADHIKRVITNPALFARKGERADVMLTHYWLQLSKALIKLDADHELVVLQSLLENIGNSGAITASLGPDGVRYLDGLVSRHTVETWKIVSELIKPPMNTRGFVITRWLRGDMGFDGRNPGPMRHIPREEIYKWIAVDPEKRAPYVANMAPKDFDPKTWQTSLVRELLCQFGESETVRSAVFSNFFTGGWSGPASSHYATVKNSLATIRESETDPNALRWLDDAIKSTEASIEVAKIDEEARGY